MDNGSNETRHWYEQLFDDYGEKYDKESFTHGTSGECDFIEKADKRLIMPTINQILSL